MSAEKVNKSYLFDNCVITDNKILPIEYIYRSLEDAANDGYFDTQIVVHGQHLLRCAMGDYSYMYAICDSTILEKRVKVTKYTLLWSDNLCDFLVEQDLYRQFYHSVLYRRYGTAAMAIWCREMAFEPLWYVTDATKFKCLTDIHTQTGGFIEKGSILILRGTRQVSVAEVYVLNNNGYVLRVNFKDLYEKIELVD